MVGAPPWRRRPRRLALPQGVVVEVRRDTAAEETRLTLRLTGGDATAREAASEQLLDTLFERTEAPARGTAAGDTPLAGVFRGLTQPPPPPPPPVVLPPEPVAPPPAVALADDVYERPFLLGPLG